MTAFALPASPNRAPWSGGEVSVPVPEGFSDPSYDSRAVRECIQEAMLLPGQPRTLPTGVLAALLPPAHLSASMAAVLLAAPRRGSLLWLGGRHAQPRLLDWLLVHTGALPAPHTSVADVAGIPACEADDDLLGRLPERGSLGRSGGSVLLIDAPELRVDPPLPRIEPGDLELTPRVCLSGHGMDRPRTLAVAGLGRPFWRARAVRQASARFGVDIVFVSGELLCAVPAHVHVTLSA